MSTYASEFPEKLFNFFLKETGFRKENFTSTGKLEKVIIKFESLNLTREVQVIVLDIVKVIVGWKNSVKDKTVILADKLIDVLFHVLECFRKYAVARAFLIMIGLLGSSISIILSLLCMLVYYLSDFITCEMLMNLKNYIKKRFNSYWNSLNNAIQY